MPSKYRERSIKLEWFWKTKLFHSSTRASSGFTKKPPMGDVCDKFYLTCLSETYINKIRVNQSVRARIWLLRECKPFREIYMSTEQCTNGEVTPGSDWRWWILTPHVGAVVASAVPTMPFPRPHQILHLVIGYIVIVTSYLRHNL